MILQTFSLFGDLRVSLFQTNFDLTERETEVIFKKNCSFPHGDFSLCETFDTYLFL